MDTPHSRFFESAFRLTLQATMILLVILFGPGIFAQAPGDVDLSFEPGGSFHLEVRAIAQQSDGKWIVGPASMRGVERLHPDGSIDHSFMKGLPGASMSETGAAWSGVRAVTVQTDDKILIGGHFRTVNGEARTRIARLNADGTLDETFGHGLAGANDRVLVLRQQSDGKILIGGGFTEVNGELRNRIARLNPDGTLDETFGNGLEGADKLVLDAAVQSDGKILIGGVFTTVNGIARKGIARLNTNGTLDTTFGSGAMALENGHANEIALQKDGKILIAGGSSTMFNGERRHGVVRLHPDGTVDSAFADALEAETKPLVVAIALGPDEKIVLATQAQPPRLERLNQDGTIDPSFSQTSVQEMIRSVAVQDDGKVLIGGEFRQVDGQVRNHLARLQADGALDISFYHRAGANRPISSVALQPDGKILTGGSFTAIDAAVRNRIARLNADGTIDETFGDSLSGANDHVSSVAVQTDGKILVGGSFSMINDAPRNGIARLNPDGTRDETFADPGVAGFRPRIRAIVVQKDGQILLGGLFEEVNGVPRSGIARLHADGRLDESFGEDLSGVGGANLPDVSAIALQSDGKILIGGHFTTVNGESRYNIARLNPDGALDETFGDSWSGVTGSPLPEVLAIALQEDGKVLIGGRFERVNGISRNGFARLNPNGTLDRSFAEGQSRPEVEWRRIHAILVQPTQAIVVGGLFTSFNEEPHRGIVRVDEEGLIDPTFGEDLTGAEGYSATVSSIVLQKDGKILIGGNFESVNGVARDHVARLHGDPLPEDGYLAWAKSLPAGQRGETDDPGGHGIPNLLRYAFGMDPLKPEREKLPQLGQRTDEGEMTSHLTLTYTRRTDDPQIYYSVEASEDLLNWAPLSGAEEVDCQSELELVTFIDSEATGPKEKRFLSVRVER